jgi:hypothetical protein
MQKAFDPFVKAHALKILIDYSGSTKRKWTAICKEIMQYARIAPSGNATLLTRQDMESWARGDSELGDSKFQHVFAFLTHPDTMARPELAHASALLDPFHRLLRIGRALAEFYSDFPSSAWLGKPDDPILGTTDEEINRRAEALCGTYVGDYKGQKVCLSLDRIDAEPFFVAHYLASSSGFNADLGDWNLTRHSGYATISQAIIVHLKGVLIPHTRALRVLPPKDDRPPETLIVLSDDLTFKSLEIVMWDSLESVRKTLPYVNPFEFSMNLSRSDDVSIQNLISNFRWRVPG